MSPSPASTTAIAPVPLDALVIPATLDGRGGTNRAAGRQAQISAANDLDAIRAWLARFTDTKTTFDNYRKEAERLVLWSVVQLGKPLSSLTHEDLLVYQHFLADPQPSTVWMAGGGRKHPRTDARWRPCRVSCPGRRRGTSMESTVRRPTSIFHGAWMHGRVRR